MQIFFALAYFVTGFAQLFAIMDGIEYATGIGGLFCVLISMFTTYIPFLGAGLGLYGAVKVWDWSLLQAVILFFWFIPAGIILVMFDRR